MPEEFVQTYLDLESLVPVFTVDFLVFFCDEGDCFVRCFRAEDVAERDVLEAEVLADVVVVGDIDACGDGGAGVCEYFEGREVWTEEFVLFKIGAPR